MSRDGALVIVATHSDTIKKACDDEVRIAHSPLPSDDPRPAPDVEVNVG
jgi:ABC-type lipoprotein export system ATPase subunit